MKLQSQKVLLIPISLFFSLCLALGLFAPCCIVKLVKCLTVLQVIWAMSAVRVASN